MRCVAVLLCLITTLVGCSHEPPAYESKYTEPPTGTISQGIPVAIIGDSYTSGTPVGGEGIRGWPKLAENQLRLQRIDVSMAVGAEGGSGYVDPGKTGKVFPAQVPLVVNPRDQLVVLLGSSNDDVPSISADALNTAVQRTLADVKATAPDAKVLVVGPFYTRPDPPPSLLAVRDIVKTQAEAAGATFVDPIAEGWFLDRPDLIAPDAHPTDGGHEYLAAKMVPLIAAQLRPTTLG